MAQVWRQQGREPSSRRRISEAGRARRHHQCRMSRLDPFWRDQFADLRSLTRVVELEPRQSQKRFATVCAILAATYNRKSPQLGLAPNLLDLTCYDHSAHSYTNLFMAPTPSSLPVSPRMSTLHRTARGVSQLLFPPSPLSLQDTTFFTKPHY